MSSAKNKSKSPKTESAHQRRQREQALLSAMGYGSSLGGSIGGRRRRGMLQEACRLVLGLTVGLVAFLAVCGMVYELWL